MKRIWPALTLFCGFLALGAVAPGRSGPILSGEAFKAGLDSINEDDLLRDLQILAGPAAEGRDSPSAGLALAAEHIASRFAAAGLLDFADGREAGEEAGAGASEQVPPDAQSYRRAFYRQLPMPSPEECVLRVDDSDEEYRYGVDFVPVGGCDGEASGTLLFCGFGIVAKREGHDDLKGKQLAGCIALIIEGEPNHRKRFDGLEVSVSSSLWRKIKDLEERKVAGVLVMRRPREAQGKKRSKKDERTAPSAKLAFRHTWAAWSEGRLLENEGVSIPVLEITAECAERLAGADLEKFAKKADRSGRSSGGPKKALGEIRISSRSKRGSVAINNLVGYLRGSDPELGNEYVVVAAHYDHVGVDSRGRIGFGADDNASGASALLEMAEAFSRSEHRRSIIFCAFASEEDGLIGSKEFCKELPVESSAIVAMINLDMVGRGDTHEVAVLGIKQNPNLEDVLRRAKKLGKTGIRKIVLRQGEELFQRSDHYSFHEIGIPALFFFEGVPISRNKDYHTWRDTLDKLDIKKIAQTARLAFNTTWILATDDARPPVPKGR